MYPGVHAAQNPDKPAIVMAGSGRTVTYGELDEHSAALASALHGLGLRKGDVVAMLSDNAAECFEIYWACMRSGLYITPVNRSLTADEVAYIVTDSEAKALIASAALADLAGKVRGMVAVEGAYAFGGKIEGYDSYEELIASAGPRLPEQPRGSDMMYSSGTTGRPKGVRQTMLPIQVDEPGDPITGLLGGVFKCGPDDVYLQPAPIYHAAPLKWSGAVQALGGTVVMMEKYDAEAGTGAHRRAQGHGRPVRADDVRPDAPASRRGAEQVRRVDHAPRRPCSGAVPARREAGDDRLVGTGRVRVLRLDRAERHHLHLQPRVAAEARLRRQGDDRRRQDLRRRGQRAACGRGRHRLLRARDAPVRVPQRPGEDPRGDPPGP